MVMQRYLTAAFLVLACLLTDGRPAASQTPMRFPADGPHAFLITVPPDWTSNEDRKHNGMQMFPKGRWGGIFLSIATDARLAGRPLLELALSISKAANIKHSGKEEPAAISGRPGTAYYGVLTNASGLELDSRIVIVPLTPDTVATLTTLAPRSMTPAQQQSLDQAVGGIALSK
jgi:hypothetical protein